MLTEKIKLGKEWIRLCQRETSEDVRKVYVCADCVVPPGAQAEIPVEISRPTWRVGPDLWATDPIEILEGWSWLELFSTRSLEC